MDLSSATWILIVLALATASLPFLLERPLIALPWMQEGEPERPGWMRWLEACAFWLLLAGLAYGTLPLVGGALLIGSDLASVALFLGRIAVVFVAAFLLMAYPGWRNKGRAVRKSFFDRLLEVLVLYVLVGMLGFAFEMNLGNRFPQTWEFYAITLSLYLVLAYPGYVYRYLFHRRPSKK